MLLRRQAFVCWGSQAFTDYLSLTLRDICLLNGRLPRANVLARGVLGPPTLLNLAKALRSAQAGVFDLLAKGMLFAVDSVHHVVWFY